MEEITMSKEQYHRHLIALQNEIASRLRRLREAKKRAPLWRGIVDRIIPFGRNENR